MKLIFILFFISFSTLAQYEELLEGDEFSDLLEMEKNELSELENFKDIPLQEDSDYLKLKDTVKIDDYNSRVYSAWDIQSIEFLENIEANDFSFEDDLIPEGDQTVFDLKELEFNQKDTYVPLPPIKKKEITLKPEPYYAVLKEGAIVENIKTKENFKLDRKLIVKAITNVVGGKIVYIFNKKGEKVFKTHIDEIKDIDKIVNLKSNPPLFQEYIPRAKMEGNDTSLVFTQNLSVSQEGLRGQYFQTLFQDENSSGTSNQFDYQIFYNWPLRLKLGLSASFQKGTWNGETKSFGWYSALYGLSLNYPLFIKKDSQWDIQLNASRYLLMRGQTLEGKSVRFQGNQFGVDLLNIHNTSYGNLFWGLTLNQSYFSVKDSDQSLVSSIRPESITTYGIKIGIRSDFEFWRFTF